MVTSLRGERYTVRIHIHAYEPGHAEIAAHLDFRDYLRAHPDQARRYARLKARLAEQHRHDIEAYIAGKGPLIRDILDRARHWRCEIGDASGAV